MDKSPDAFRTIREVADWLGVAAHVLRFWESKFTQVRPVKRAGGRRYYRPGDMELLGGIKVLLHDRGMTVRGVQRLLKDEGVAAISALSPPLDTVTAAPELSEGIGEEAAWQADADSEPGQDRETDETDAEAAVMPPAQDQGTATPDDSAAEPEVTTTDEAGSPPLPGLYDSSAAPSEDGEPSADAKDASPDTNDPPELPSDAAAPSSSKAETTAGEPSTETPESADPASGAEALKQDAPGTQQPLADTPASLSRGLDTIWHMASDRQASGEEPTETVRSAIDALEALRARVAGEIDENNP